MREVEVKASISDSNILVKNLLLKNAKFIQRIIQEDKIFIDKTKDFLKLSNSDKIFRIRKIGNDFEFNLKIPINNELDCLEYELKIDNVYAMEKILSHLDFIEVISVIKTRDIYKYGELTFNIDLVENLGEFVELEKMVNCDDISEHQLDLKKILLDFYKLPIEFINFGYDTLLYKKNNS